MLTNEHKCCILRVLTVGGAPQHPARKEVGGGMVRWELWVIVWIAGRGLAGVALAVAALW